MFSRDVERSVYVHTEVVRCRCCRAVTQHVAHRGDILRLSVDDAGEGSARGVRSESANVAMSSDVGPTLHQLAKRFDGQRLGDTASVCGEQVSGWFELGSLYVGRKRLLRGRRDVDENALAGLVLTQLSARANGTGTILSVTRPQAKKIAGA